MAYNGWRSLKKSKPEITEFVKVAHKISGIGAPEREGWETTGKLRSNGFWRLKQNAEGTVDFREPTHWKKI